jgi:hypothetical protein
MRSIIVLSAFIALTGCAAAWGKPYKTEFQSPSSITINYDAGLTNMGEVQNVAQTHCAAYGKDAVPGASQTSDWGMRTTSFDCITRQ